MLFAGTASGSGTVVPSDITGAMVAGVALVVRLAAAFLAGAFFAGAVASRALRLADSATSWVSCCAASTA